MSGKADWWRPNCGRGHGLHGGSQAWGQLQLGQTSLDGVRLGMRLDRDAARAGKHELGWCLAVLRKESNNKQKSQNVGIFWPK